MELENSLNLAREDKIVAACVDYPTYQLCARGI